MKKNAPIWGSISTLIGVVIAILALTGGVLRIALLIAAFAVWGLWVILALVLPARRAVKIARATGPNTALMRTLLHHVNYRISDCLKSAYPEATWEWTMRDPVAFAAQGGTGRIRVSGIPDYDYADITLDRNGRMACSLVRLAPVNGARKESAAPGQDPLNPRVWYETQGREILEPLVSDLASRGHHSLTLKEDGSICVNPPDGGEEVCQVSFPSFPDRSCWSGLVQVLERHGLAGTATATGIVVAW